MANAIAGGGTAIAYPTLIWLGLPPVSANATNSVALWPGSISAAWSYRARLRDSDRRWLRLIPMTLVGGAAGAWLLIRLPPQSFRFLAPYLVISASALLAVEPLLRRKVQNRARAGARKKGTAVAAVAGASLYGGYFGAGLGVMLLLALDALGLEKVHDANAWKNAYAAAIKAAAVAYLALSGKVVWLTALTMAVGATTGGALGGSLIQRAPERLTRWLIVAVGIAMGIALLVSDSLG